MFKREHLLFMIITEAKQYQAVLMECMIFRPSHVTIIVNGNQVNCYDFESGFHLNFNVNGNCVSAYDFADSCHYNYSVN